MSSHSSELQLARITTFTCSGCGEDSGQKPWGAYEVRYGGADRKTVVSKLPSGTACGECLDLHNAIYFPTKKAWADVEASLTTPAGRAAFQEMRARRAGKKVKFTKQDVETVVSTTWTYQAEFQPVAPADLRRRYPHADFARVPGLRLERIRNENNELVEVYLLRTGKAKVFLSTESTSRCVDHVMAADSQLRATQGQEHWTELLRRTLQNRPRTDVISEAELDLFLGGGRQVAGNLAGHVPDNGGSSSSGLPQSGSADLRAAALAIPDGLEHEILTDGHVVMEQDLGCELDLLPPNSGCDFPPVASGEPPAQGGRRRSLGEPSDRDAKKARQNKPVTRRPLSEADPEVTITVEKILRGAVEKPKVAIYHREQKLPALKKTESEINIVVEEAEIAALKAATSLLPSELPRISDLELRPALNTVLKHIGVQRLPLETVLGLTRRAALLQLKSPELFWETVWPGHVVEPGHAFDPHQPKLSGAHGWPTSTPASLAEWAAKTIAEDCLGSLMARKDSHNIQSPATNFKPLRNTYRTLFIH